MKARAAFLAVFMFSFHEAHAKDFCESLKSVAAQAKTHFKALTGARLDPKDNDYHKSKVLLAGAERCTILGSYNASFVCRMNIDMDNATTQAEKLAQAMKSCFPAARLRQGQGAAGRYVIETSEFSINIDSEIVDSNNKNRVSFIIEKI